MELPATRIIAMSGGDMDFLDVAEAFGAHRTLRKPFMLNDSCIRYGKNCGSNLGAHATTIGRARYFKRDLYQRHCSVCQTTHQAFGWLYQEEAGGRQYICIEGYLKRPYEEPMGWRLYGPD